MCGFVALIRRNSGQSLPDLHDTFIRHRGPDGSKSFNDGIFLATHSRLSVVDVSDASNQPFISEDGRYVLVFNGEIYNHRDLRSYLNREYSTSFKTCGDTEVLLYGLVLEGIDFLLKCNGMWSFVLWDSLTKTAIAARDRFGEKPLYYGYTKRGDLVFGSEIPAVVDVQGSWADLFALKSNARDVWNSESSEDTFFSSIKKIRGGHFATISEQLVLAEHRYWNTLDNLTTPPSSYNGQVDYFRELFIDAVRLRCENDIGFAGALSGGLDSSVVAAIANKLIKDGTVSPPRPQRYYVSYYDDDYLDEHKAARMVADHLGVPLSLVDTKYPEQHFSMQQAMSIVFEMAVTLPQPMLMLYKSMKADGYSVSLDGHGADELFSGYSDAILLGGNVPRDGIEPLWEYLKQSNDPALLMTTSSKYLDIKISYIYKKFGRALRSLFIHDINASHIDVGHVNFRSMSSFSQRLYSLFHYSVLPTLLRNYDRYSMASGVEIRMPFLDHRVVTFVNSLPDSAKFKDGFSKRILRDAFRDFLPSKIVDAKIKKGWNAPSNKWLYLNYQSEILELIRQKNPPRKRHLENIFNDIKDKDFINSQDDWLKLQPHVWLQSIINEYGR